MDTVIDYDEAAGFLKNPPSLEPRPNFIYIRALQKHIMQGLVQLSCPQSTIVTVPQAAATATMAGSLLGMTPGSTVNAEIAAAISQLSANQMAIMLQMAAMSFAPATTQDTRRTQLMFQVPPIQQLEILVQQSFQQSAFNGRRGGGHGRRRGREGQGRTPFTDHMHMAGGIPAMPSAVFPLAHRGTQIPLINGGAQMTPSQGDSRDNTCLTFTRDLTIGMCASCVASTLKMNTRPPRAH
jgi:hypothetical protein